MNVLDKIQALKRLAENQNATPHEAASAAARMQELMLKHAITEAEVGIDDEQVEWASDSPLYVARRRSLWRQSLAFGIAETNGCKALLGIQPNGVVRITLVGRSSDVVLVHHFYDFLSREVDRLAKQYLETATGSASGRRLGEGYRQGCVAKLIARMREQAEATKQQARSNGQTAALVRVDSRLVAVKKWFEDHNIKVSSAAKREVDGGAYRQGVEDGDQIPLHRPIDVQSPQDEAPCHALQQMVAS